MPIHPGLALGTKKVEHYTRHPIEGPIDEIEGLLPQMPRGAAPQQIWATFGFKCSNRARARMALVERSFLIDQNVAQAASALCLGAATLSRAKITPRNTMCATRDK